MATPSKRSSKPAVKKLPRPAPKPAAASKPFLRFYHSGDLRARTLAVLAALEKSANPAQHRDDLAEVVVDLTDAGMDYYFMKPLKLSKANFIVQQSARVGMAGTLQVLGTVIRNIVGRMDGPQLLSVCGSIRQLMR
jgi:hypothetical protein